MDGVPTGNVKTLLALMAALEAAGVKFLGAPDNAPGVCLVGKTYEVNLKDVK